MNRVWSKELTLALAGAVLTVAATAVPTDAAIVTVNENRVDIVGPTGQTVTFDTANAVDTGTSNLLPGTNFLTGGGNTDFRNRHNSPLGFDLTPTMIVNNDPSYAPGTGFRRNGTSVQYYSLRGNTLVRDSITVGWGAGTGSPNNLGADLCVMEWSNNEGYLVRLSTDDGSNYSDWYYTPAAWSANNTSNGILTWQTLIDYSDFGISSGQYVTNVEFASVLEGDKGTASGGSFLLDAGGSLLINPQTGNPFAASAVAGYSNNTDLTADIWYAVSLNNVGAVPEPASMSLLALGGLTLLRRRRETAA